MKIRIPKQDLQDAVNKVKTVVSPKSALPILSHILMEAEGSSVKLSATDLKVSIECAVDCTVDEPGAMTVSSHRLSAIIGELPSEDIVLSLNDSVISLECGKIQTKLFSMAPEEFPPIRSFEGVTPIELPQPLLKTFFLKTSFAICSDQARYNLTGLLFELQDSRLTTVSTDGRRMSLYADSERIPTGTNVKVIVPGKMISELERLLGDDGVVKVYVGENQAAFEFDTIRLVTALIEGNFPNYEMVIPKKHDKEATINTGQFMEAIRRTRTMTNDKFNSVRFHLSNNVLTLKVVTPEVGEYREEMAVEYDNDEIEVAFNPDFVLEAVRRIESDSVCIVLKDGMSPGVIKPYSDAPRDNHINVIMPIRI